MTDTDSSPPVPPETEEEPEYPPEAEEAPGFFGDSPADPPLGPLPPPTLFWWVRYLVGVGLSGVFLAFGVEVLIAAYGLNDPFFFVMTFFSANFMILISAALMVGLILRMVETVRRSRKSS
jgi:hypothetical protein